MKNLSLVGFASGMASGNPGTNKGPQVMRQSPYLIELANNGINLDWQEIIEMKSVDKIKPKNIPEAIANLCQKLAVLISKLIQEKKFFAVIGGDHTCAIGTWSGAYHSLRKQGPLGLIWIDAHMDSHTPETTESGNIHGMPLACLMGYGIPSLIHVLDKEPKLKPEHVCLIGVRSFEKGEAELLKKLNVRIFFMDEVKERGLNTVMKEGLTIATTGTAKFGLSIDMDALDPVDAPGIGNPEPNGIKADELLDSLSIVANHPKLIGFDIAEFNPFRDNNHKTERLIVNLMSTISLLRQ